MPATRRRLSSSDGSAWRLDRYARIVGSANTTRPASAATAARAARSVRSLRRRGGNGEDPVSMPHSMAQAGRRGWTQRWEIRRGCARLTVDLRPRCPPSTPGDAMTRPWKRPRFVPAILAAACVLGGVAAATPAHAGLIEAAMLTDQSARLTGQAALSGPDWSPTRTGAHPPPSPARHPRSRQPRAGAAAAGSPARLGRAGHRRRAGLRARHPGAHRERERHRWCPPSRSTSRPR